MTIYEILHKKRSGLPLTEEEIAFFVSGYTAGKIPDYQAAAFCMAVCCNGMTESETAALTDCMVRSGERVDLSCLGDRTVDKHSTGGVGDKTTPILAPLVASLGGCVAKMSGRGLGHTGGTVDKLEAIPGYRTELSRTEFLKQAESIGVAVIGQSGNLVPADKKLYALRDVTATVDSIPLIASSIMSKKIAAGSHNILLDVKIGSGAFMKTEKDGRALAEQMVKVGRACGRRVSAFLTDMDTPLGYAIGNAIEIEEAAAVLRGGGPRDLREISLSLAAEMLSLSLGLGSEDAYARAAAALDDGRALACAEKWIAAQGGDPSFLTSGRPLTAAAHICELRVTEAGYLTHMNTEQIGLAAAALGAGRRHKEDAIDLAAGIVLAKKTGDKLEKGELLATLYTNRPAACTTAESLFRTALSVSPDPSKTPPLILGRVG